jgi:hypothetical protein
LAFWRLSFFFFLLKKILCATPRLDGIIFQLTFSKHIWSHYDSGSFRQQEPWKAEAMKGDRMILRKKSPKM